MVLGTILPTAKSLRMADAHAARIADQCAQVGKSKLAGCKIKRLGRETRYYSSPYRYAVVDRSMTVRWFDVREDGDYPVK